MSSTASHSATPLSRLNYHVYRVERQLAGLLFLVMAGVMFLYVAQRVYSRPDGRLPAIIASLAGGVSAETLAWLNGGFSTALNLVLTWLFCYAAFRSMVRKQGQIPRGQAALYATGGTAVLAGAVKLVLVMFPNGLIWGPTICLACMLWVGFIGASLATYEKRHLALEMGEKLWPKKIFHYVKAASLVTAAGMCVFLLWLAKISITEHYETWAQNPLAGILLPTKIPIWLMLMVIPYAFTVMGLRFLGQAARVVVNPEEAAGGEMIPGVPGAEPPPEEAGK